MCDSQYNLLPFFPVLVGIARSQASAIQYLAKAEAMGEASAAQALKEVEDSLGTAATSFESEGIELGLAKKHTFAAQWEAKEHENECCREGKRFDRELIGFSIEEGLSDPEQLGMLQQDEFNSRHRTDEKKVHNQSNHRPCARSVSKGRQPLDNDKERRLLKNPPGAPPKKAQLASKKSV